MLSRYEELRPYLFAIAYRMLGSAADADDIVQEAFLRGVRTAEEEVQNPRAYMATIVTRLCLDEIKSARRKREEYAGAWLPEPVLTSGSTVDVESISFAFLTLLETLSAEERAVLLLRDVFGYEYDEIAAMIGKSADNCRQLLHRARTHLQQRKERFRPRPDAQRRLVDGFLAALREGNPDAFSSILAKDVVLTSDSGGRVPAARQPVSGLDRVSRFFVGIMSKAPADADIRILDVNGEPGIAAFIGGRLVNVVSFEMDAERISAIRVVLNPDKLQRVARELGTVTAA